MAQLKDTLIQGSARVTDTLYANDLNLMSAQNNKYQSLISDGTTALAWKPALLMSHDVPTLASLSITNMNNVPFGVNRVTNSTEAAAITNTPVLTCGGMVYTLGGYNNSDSTYKWQFYLGADYNRTFVRHMDGSTWGGWYRMPRISSTVSTAIGGTKTPVYVDSTGEIVAGTALKNLAYKDSLAATDIPTISITDKTSGTLTVGRGGTGTTTFTAGSILIGNDANAINSGDLKIVNSNNQTLIQPVTDTTNLSSFGFNATNRQLYLHSNKGVDIGSNNSISLTSNKFFISLTTSLEFYYNNTDYMQYCGGFSSKGKLELYPDYGMTSTQETHQLYVEGDSAFNGKISFGNLSSYTTITESASMQYDSTFHAIKFIVT